MASNPTLMAFIPNWNWNENQKFRMQNLASDPAGTPAKGWMYFNTTDNVPRIYNGTTFIDMAGTGGSSSPLTTKGDIWAYSSTDARFPVGVTNKMALVVNSAQTFGLEYVLMDHTYISDFDTQVRTSALNQMTAPTADVSMNSHKLTNLTDGSSAQDAVTFAQLSALSQGVTWKAPVRAVSVANATLASAYENGDTLDGLTLATGDRILLTAQTSASENGIWVVAASGSPARATDADANGEIKDGVFVPVSAGTAGADSIYYCTATGATPWVAGTSTSTWARFTSLADLVAGAGMTKTGQTMNVIGGSAPSTGGAGGGLVVNADDVVVDATVVELGKAITFGDNAASTFTLTHSLNSKKVHVTFRDATTDEVFYAFWKSNNVNSVDVDMNGYVLASSGAIAHISATQ